MCVVEISLFSFSGFFCSSVSSVLLSTLFLFHSCFSRMLTRYSFFSVVHLSLSLSTLIGYIWTIPRTKGNQWIQKWYDKCELCWQLHWIIWHWTHDFELYTMYVCLPYMFASWSLDFTSSIHSTRSQFSWFPCSPQKKRCFIPFFCSRSYCLICWSCNLEWRIYNILFCGSYL